MSHERIIYTDADCAELQDTNARLTARVAELEAALKPFAAIHDETMLSFSYEGDSPVSGYPDDRHAWGFNRKDLTWGDFRRARAALAGGSE